MRPKLEIALSLLNLEEEDYQEVADLSISRGWEIIRNHLNASMEVLAEKLTVEEDPDIALILRERYRAINALIDTVGNLRAEFDERQLQAQNKEEENE